MVPAHINIWAVIVCAIINILLGMTWYSPKVLGTLWAKEHGFDLEQLKPTFWHYIAGVIVAFVLSIVFNMMIHAFGIVGIGNGIALGFFIWLGFIATSHFSGVIWAKKPFIVYFIDAGFMLLNLIVIGAIMAVWQ
jgi:hypothetical protein